jgi:hypothetical protein
VKKLLRNYGPERAAAQRKLQRDETDAAAFHAYNGSTCRIEFQLRSPITPSVRISRQIAEKRRGAVSGGVEAAIHGAKVPPIHLFIDTSVMPRDLARIGHDFNKLAELVAAKLVKVHMSEIAVREWRSQIVTEYLKLVKNMHGGVRAVAHHPLTAKLGHHKLLAQLAADKKALVASAETVATQACDAFINRLGANTVKLDGDDAGNVFKHYFAGDPPFGQPKQRIDIPDAFIYQAACRLLLTLPVAGMHAFVGDGQLGKALGKLPNVTVVESAKAFFQTDIAKEAMTHLELYKVWTGKEEQVLAFLAKQTKFVEKKLYDYAFSELQGSTISDDSIPVDNNEAIVGSVDDVRDIEVDWDSAEEPGPGWVTVPFEFICETQLNLMVFRADAFSLPDWIEVDVGDFEEDYYFEASAHRDLRVSGHLSFSYTKEELEASKIKRPDSVEVEPDIHIELIPLLSDEKY